MNPSLAQQVQESAERIAKLEMQQREIQWRIVTEQRNFERLRTLERFETERSILAAKQTLVKPLEWHELSPEQREVLAEKETNPNADVVQVYPEGRWTI